jgi:SAM-dependent methyltransferase
VKTSSSCLCCGGKVSVLVDFGPQTPSNRFELPESPATDRHPLVVGQCEACGLFQLLDPMPPAMAKSRFEWLTYNEPEGHLDDLVSRLRRLPGLDSGSRIVGLTYKDESTLARFNRLGYANTYRYEPSEDFGLTDSCASLESIQAALGAETAARLASSHGLADVLLVRHVFEHAHDPRGFLRAAAMLVKPGGYLLFEMPDSEKFIRACDYSFIWEEHITYLCAPTLAALIGNAGLSLQDTIVYPYPLEDSLIGIVRNVPGSVRHQQGNEVLLADGANFGRRHQELRARLQTLLGDWRLAGKKAAIFGAGHLAAKFVNMYGLEKLVDCVIDDNPHKRALLMPGSRLAIRSSAELDERGIDFCLLSLSPESERKVRAKNQPFLDRGGRFLSIFALSPISVYAEDLR